ncbi:helix-turn-helix domain-containing protein [Aquitalea magnusonii]|uniref:helix-turn-helix domain-containing protein n=1 Tax=Aquitalea magnusonii TaxID=332411 RepID=UPI000B5C2C5A|nr:helix-turn-helix transcriptional regulator [Aquitalea magnusonii]
MDISSEHAILIAFGDTVRRHRVELGLSQEALAEIVSLHRTYIGSVERGERNVSLLNLCKIAHALGLSVSELLSRAEDELPVRPIRS